MNNLSEFEIVVTVTNKVDGEVMTYRRTFDKSMDEVTGYEQQKAIEADMALAGARVIRWLNPTRGE